MRSSNDNQTLQLRVLLAANALLLSAVLYFVKGVLDDVRVLKEAQQIEVTERKVLAGRVDAVSRSQDRIEIEQRRAFEKLENEIYRLRDGRK